MSERIFGKGRVVGSWRGNVIYLPKFILTN